MLLWLTAQVRVHRLVPKLLNTFPVLNLTGLKDVAQLMRLGIGDGLVTDEEVKVWVVKFIGWFLIFEHIK